MNNYNEVKKSFGTQAEKFASYHMSKAEYTDYLIRSRGHIVVNPDLTVTCDTHSTWKFNA